MRIVICEKCKKEIQVYEGQMAYMTLSRHQNSQH
jgi:hypothetical protein